jgi:hypothetical protein
MFERTATRYIIRRWLTRWIVNDWVNTKFLFRSLNVCTTSRDFSNALLVSKCFISSTNRELNIRTSDDTSFLLTDWKTSFSMRSLISFFLNAANWRKAMCMTESSLKTTTRANIEAKAKARSTVVLNTKLKYAVDAKYLWERSRSRLNEFEKSFRFWFLINRKSELIIWLKHIRWLRNKCDEREINNRDKKRWVLEMIIVIIRFDHCWSKFCQVASKFNDH